MNAIKNILLIAISISSIAAFGMDDAATKKAEHWKRKEEFLGVQNDLKASELGAKHIGKVALIQVGVHTGADIISKSICFQADQLRKKHFGKTPDEELLEEASKEQNETKKAEKAYLNAQTLYQDLQTTIELCKQKVYKDEAECKAKLRVFADEIEQRRQRKNAK
jgi:hypothetical protein